MKKDIKFSTRMASKDREDIKELAKRSGMSMSDYVAVCCLLYLVVLVINKLGKSSSICLGIAFGGAMLVLIALFKYVFSRELVNSFINFMIKAMGFMADGTINLLFPVLTLLAAAAVLGGGAYAVLRRTELK